MDVDFNMFVYCKASSSMPVTIIIYGMKNAVKICIDLYIERIFIFSFKSNTLANDFLSVKIFKKNIHQRTCNLVIRDSHQRGSITYKEVKRNYLFIILMEIKRTNSMQRIILNYCNMYAAWKPFNST